MYADIMAVIISARKQQGITSEDLAAKADITTNCEKYFERFDVVPNTTVETLCKILVALGLKIKIEP